MITRVECGADFENSLYAFGQSEKEIVRSMYNIKCYLSPKILIGNEIMKL